MPVPKNIPLYSIEDIIETAKQTSKAKTEEEKDIILEYVGNLLGQSEDAVWQLLQN